MRTASAHAERHVRRVPRRSGASYQAAESAGGSAVASGQELGRLANPKRAHDRALARRQFNPLEARAARADESSQVQAL